MRDSSIGEQIKKARKLSGMTQKELAVAIGYESASFISNIEKGSRPVSVGTLNNIADALGYTFSTKFEPKHNADNVPVSLSDLQAVKQVIEQYLND